MNADHVDEKNVFRINQLQYAYTHGNQLHSIAPKLLQTIVHVNTGTVGMVTHSHRNEHIVDFSTTAQRKTISTLAKVCAFVAFLHENGISHGSLHENAIYHSKEDNAYVLRDFDVDLTEFTPKYDITCLRAMLGRVAMQSGLDASVAINALTSRGPARASETLADMLCETDHLVTQCVVERNVARRANINATFSVYSVVDIQNIDAIIHTVAMAFLNHWHNGMIPMFSVSKEKGIGWGPTTEIVNAFLDAMYSSGKLVYENHNINGDSQIISIEENGLNIDQLIGYVLMYAIYFNLSINIPPPPKNMIMFLLSSKKELHGMRDAMQLGDSKKNRILIGMWTGASLFVASLRNEGWTSFNLCEYIISQWERNYDNTTLHAHQFDFDTSFTAAQKAVFVQWATKHASTETLRGFVYALTGSRTLDMYAIYRLRWDDDQKKVDFYQWHISSCYHTLRLYRNNVNLSHFATVVAVDNLVRAIIASVKRNVYNDQ